MDEKARDNPMVRQEPILKNNEAKKSACKAFRSFSTGTIGIIEMIDGEKRIARGKKTRSKT